MHYTQKTTFSSQIGFAAAAAGSSIGLYNMWKFPYEVHASGGGAFIVLYLFAVICFGYPLLLGELALGRFTGRNTYQTYAQLAGKPGKVLGGLCIGMAFLLLSFYQVFSAYIVGYGVQAVSGDLFEGKETIASYATYFKAFSADYTNNIFYLLLINGIALFIIIQGLRQGIERFTKLLMPFFFILFLGLLLYACSRENAYEGIKKFVMPKFKDISPRVVLNALEQALSSIGIGIGVLITYGSYLSKKTNLPQAGSYIAIGDTIVSLMSGLFIFALLSHHQIMEEVKGGPELSFIVLPFAFKVMTPWIARLIGSLFFLLLGLATVTSSIAIMELIVKCFMEQWGLSRRKASLSIIGFTTLLNLLIIPSFGGIDQLTHLLSLHHQSYSLFDIAMGVFSFMMPIMCLILFLMIIRYLSIERFLEEVKPSSPLLRYYLKGTLYYIAPILLVISLIVQLYHVGSFLLYGH